MGARNRIRKYREVGGAADLVRVEVLVPSADRALVLAEAARMRAAHRQKKQQVEALCSKAIDRYAAKLFDNVDLDRITDPLRQASVVASALMERGDARAFAMARQILAELEA